LKISEPNSPGSAVGNHPHPLSARLALNRDGEDDFKLFWGGKLFLPYNDPVFTSPARS
jgi:hypothetical protein